MKLSKEDIEFIKNLSHEMKTQDNRCTAQPYALVIRNKNREVRDFDNCENKGVYWNESEYDSFEEFVESFKDYYLEDNETHEVIDYLNDNIEDIGDLRRHEYEFYDLFGIQISTFAYEDVMTSDSIKGLYEGNFFLTENACKLYIERNRHNLNSPDTYGIHLYRNPEMEKLYEIIHKLADML